MDVWTLGEKLKVASEGLSSLEKRIEHIEGYLKGLNSKLESINKVANEEVQDKKPKSSSVRKKRSVSNKS
jgi:CO/xanthine dehydrogenase FAD-binding subunit